jgi:hypothetical protein
VTLTTVQYRHGLIWLVLVGAVLRIIGLNWDGGRGLHPDEGNLVRAALTLGVDGRILPEFHAYNDLALWLPRLLSLPFCGAQDGVCLTLVARALSAAMSWAMILPGAALACRLAGEGTTGRIAGLAAALALATSGPLVQWAHFGTTESALAALVILVWWLAALWDSRQVTDRQMALLSGVAIGVGFGFKTTALVVGIIPALAIALAARSLGAKFRMLVLFGVVAGVQALAFAPSVVLATESWLGVMQFENGVVTGSLPVFWTAQFHGATNLTFELRQLWGLLSGAGLVLAMAALPIMPRAAWRLAVPALAFVLVYAALTFGWHAKFARYLAPLVPVLLVLAGVAVGILARGGWTRTGQAAALAGLGLMGLAGLDSASAYLRPDPRLAMERHLLALTAPADLVAVEPRDLAQSGGRAQITLPLTEAVLTPDTFAAPLAEANWLIIASRRNWGVLPRQPDANPLICGYYAGLADGSLGYALVRRTDRRGVFGHLFSTGLAGEETRTVFDRPDVLLFRNVGGLDVSTLALRLSQPRAPVDCTAATLARAWGRGA